MKIFSWFNNEYVNIKKRHDLIICIGDLHIPFHHPKAFLYLERLIAKYEKLYGVKAFIVNIGDLFDEPARHNKHVKSHFFLAKEDIYKNTIKAIAKLKKIVPEMIITEGNHDVGASLTAINDGRDLRDTATPHQKYPNIPETWKYVPYLTTNGVYFVHGLKKAHSEKSSLAALKGISCVQGHYHTMAGVNTWITPDGKPIFNAFTGCLIDPSNAAFEYCNAQQMMNTIKLSSLVIYKGQAMIVPMKELVNI